MMTIAALYVNTDGPYFGLDGVDPWDESRDARSYPGRWRQRVDVNQKCGIGLASVKDGRHRRPSAISCWRWPALSADRAKKARRRRALTDGGIYPSAPLSMTPITRA